MPTEQDFSEMIGFNEKMAAAGVMVDGDGLQPSAKGARINFGGGKATVTRGPFGDVRTLVAGFWLLKAASLDEAVEWISRAPFKDGEVEVRQIFEAEDFGDALTPELREKSERTRAGK